MNIDPRDTRLPAPIKPLVATLQVIFVAFIAGAILMAGIVAWLRAQGDIKAAEGAGAVFLPLAILFALCALAGSRVVSGLLTKYGRRQIVAGDFELPPGDPYAQLVELGAAGKLWLLYQLQAILGAGVLEGGAVFCVSAYLLTGEALALVPGAVLLWILGMSFPTAARVADWIDRQLRLITEERQFSLKA